MKSALEINSCRAYFLDEDKLGKTTNWSNLFHDEEIDFSDLRGINLMFTDPESSSLDTNKAFDRLVLYRNLLLYVLKESQLLKNCININALTFISGDYGRSKVNSIYSIYGGYFSGLFKCLSIEHSHCNFKVIDLDPLTNVSINTENIINEIKYAGRVEVGYRNNERFIFEVSKVPFNDNKNSAFPAENSVILVFGGARGITAECLKHVKSTNCNFILVGRSYDMDYPSEFDKYDTFEEVKKALIIKYSGTNKITPSELNSKCRGILRQKEINANISSLSSGGCNVEYMSADVTDLQQLKMVIETVYARYKRIDGVIHAAGLLKDKLFLDQSTDSFELVYKTKVTVLEALTKFIDINKLSLIIFFSSVAGRFGNAGQSDYAAANETITRFSYYAKHLNSNLSVNSIHWGPWDTTGMASEAVKEKFRKQGIIPIPVNIGILTFEKIFNGCFNDVELISGEGPWIGYETHSAEDKLKSNNDQYPLSPFIQSSIINEPTGAVHYIFELNKLEHLFLSDHKIDSNLVLPATAAMELMAELVQNAWPDWNVTEISSLRVLKGIAIDDGITSKSFKVRGIPSTHADAYQFPVSVSIEDIKTKQIYYKATVKLSSTFTKSEYQNLDVNQVTFNLESNLLYKDYLFHGPLFQLIENSSEPDETGISSIVKSSNITTWFASSSPSQSWIFDPGLLDTGPQLAIVWARLVHNTTPLPNQFESVIRYRKPHPSEKFVAVLEIKNFDGINITYDVAYYDINGDLVFKMTGSQGTCNTSLNRLSAQ